MKYIQELTDEQFDDCFNTIDSNNTNINKDHDFLSEGQFVIDLARELSKETKISLEGTLPLATELYKVAAAKDAADVRFARQMTMLELQKKI